MNTLVAFIIATNTLLLFIFMQIVETTYISKLTKDESDNSTRLTEIRCREGNEVIECGVNTICFNGFCRCSEMAILETETQQCIIPENYAMVFIFTFAAFVGSLALIFIVCFLPICSCCGRSSRQRMIVEADHHENDLIDSTRNTHSWTWSFLSRSNSNSNISQPSQSRRKRGSDDQPPSYEELYANIPAISSGRVAELAPPPKYESVVKYDTN